MNRSLAEAIFKQWLNSESDNDSNVGTQEHLLDNWGNEAVVVGQDDINPDDIKKSRIEEVQAEIAGDEDSPETEIIIDDKQATEPEDS